MNYFPSNYFPFKISYLKSGPTVRVFHTLKRAQEAMDEVITYTQKDVEIMDEDGKVLSYRKWIGDDRAPSAGVRATNPDNWIDFGQLGCYTPWIDTGNDAPN